MTTKIHVEARDKPDLKLPLTLRASYRYHSYLDHILGFDAICWEEHWLPLDHEGL